MVVPNFSSKVVPMGFPSKVILDKLFPGMVVQNYFRIVVPTFPITVVPSVLIANQHCYPRIVIPSFPTIVVPSVLSANRHCYPNLT